MTRGDAVARRGGDRMRQGVEGCGRGHGGPHTRHADGAVRRRNGPSGVRGCPRILERHRDVEPDGDRVPRQRGRAERPTPHRMHRGAVEPGAHLAREKIVLHRVGATFTCPSVLSGRMRSRSKTSVLTPDPIAHAGYSAGARSTTAAGVRSAAAARPDPIATPSATTLRRAWRPSSRSPERIGRAAPRTRPARRPGSLRLHDRVLAARAAHVGHASQPGRAPHGAAPRLRKVITRLASAARSIPVARWSAASASVNAPAAAGCGDRSSMRTRPARAPAPRPRSRAPRTARGPGRGRSAAGARVACGILMSAYLAKYPANR